jgi:hypothetical protein
MEVLEVQLRWKAKGKIMRDIDSRDLLDSISYTLREDLNSSLFNTTMPDVKIDNTYLKDIKELLYDIQLRD